MSVKDAAKKAWVCFVAALPVLFFLAGITWVLLFPALSITTGELKPRGMYVDEHSLLVQSGIVGKPAIVPLYGIVNSSDICGALDRSKLRCSYASDDNFEETSIIQIEITPRHARTNFDTTVLTFRYTDYAYVQSEVLRLVGSVAVELAQSRWNTRKVIILLLPSGNSTQNSAESEALQYWLQRHHKPTLEQIIESELPHSSSGGSSGGGSGGGSSRKDGSEVQHILQTGAIREAYIFDLTDYTIWADTVTSTLDTPNISSTATTAIATTSSNTPHTLQFTSATLQHTGGDGLLPNMDLIAYPLSLYPRILQAESQVCGDNVNMYIQGLYGGNNNVGSSGSNHINRATVSVIQTLLPLVQAIDNALPRAYKHRLLSLLCSIHTLSTNTATGLHGYFSQLNIDSITIKPTFSVVNSGNTLTKHSNGLKKKSSTKSRGGTSGVEKYDVSMLLEMVMSCVYVSNNLQEELHHSHFYYLLMGSGHFVSINEYGFTAALFLASVLCMFVQLCNVQCADCTGTDTMNGSVMGKKNSVRQYSMYYVDKSVFSAVLSVVVPVVWVMCVPMLYSSGAAGYQCSDFSSDIFSNLYHANVDGRNDNMLHLLCCLLHYARVFIVYYVPIECVDGVTLTLCGVACVSAFLRGVDSKRCSVGSMNDGGVSGIGSSDGSTVDLGNTSVSVDITRTLATPCANITNLSLCVYMLFVLVGLSYVFAFNFSLGLVLTVYVVPSMLIVTCIDVHCAGSVGTSTKVMIVVLLAVVLMCSVSVMNSTVSTMHSSVKVVWVVASLLVCLSACTVLGRVLNVRK